MAFDGITVAGLAEEMRSRILGARISKIAQPEDDELYDMLLNIRFLEKKAKVENIDITYQALTYIVIHVGNSHRELEVALSRVVAYSELAGEKITANLVADALKGVYPEKK